MTNWIYSFGEGTADGRAEMNNLLGGKGANLAEMSHLGLPVPPDSPSRRRSALTYYANQPYVSEDSSLARSRRRLALVEKRIAPNLAMPTIRLLVSVRSGARASMPGMMDTVLNLGLNDKTVDRSRQKQR